MTLSYPKKTPGLRGKMTKILKTDLDEYWRLSLLAGGYSGKILDRITYVLRAIYKEFGAELDYWYFDGAGEGEVGDLDSHLDKDSIHSFMIFTKEPYEGDEMFAKLDDGTYAEFGYDFPTRWLYEDFEDELSRGVAIVKQEALDEEKKKAEKKAAKKAEKERLKASAASKLTPEERKALGLKN